MSYQCEDKKCPRVQRMSSSDTNIRYNGKAVGDESQDNSRLINERRKIVANYRTKNQFLPITSGTSTSQSSPTTAPTIPSINVNSNSIIDQNSKTNEVFMTDICQWDESLLEINVMTDNKPGHIELSITKNGKVIDSLSLNHDANSNIKYKQCVLAGSCYELTINDVDGDGNGGKVKITENGDLVLQSDYDTKRHGHSFQVPVDGTVKHKIGWPGQNKLECSWLETQGRWKNNLECSKPYIRSVCPRICHSCQ